jgi:hypothetical protein
MADRWSRSLARTAFRPSQEHGGDSRLVVAGSRLGAYFTKGLYGVKTPESTAHDVTHSFGKAGRRGNVTPFGLLARLLEEGDAADLDLWHEWERESKGKRQLVWSNGLRADLGVGPEESDEDAAAASDGSVVLCSVTGQAYARLARCGGLLSVLEAAERGGESAVWAVLARFGLAGYDPPGWRRSIA